MGLALLAAAALGPAPASAQAPEPRPLRLGVEHRTRFERVVHDYRAGSGSDAGLSLRTLLEAEAGRSAVRLSLEVEDSRAYATHGAPLNTTHVDALELLQAALTLRGRGVLSAGDEASLRVGRFTMDMGSRRLLARSVFRNTINAFTGLELVRTTPSGAVRAFAVLPVTRRPSAPADLADNRVRLDREDTDALFWGAGYESPVWAGDLRVDAYVVGLLERDGSDKPSRNRRLFTPGMRVLRSPAAGRVDFELEAMLQLGTSRATAAPTDALDLDHRAFAWHASAGYDFRAPWALRLVLQYDYASGDRDPEDDAHNGFDPLFGARAFELNPTGLYGPFVRSNISSPGLRIEASPGARIGLMGACRLYWLASARDAWTTAELRDPTGGSGTFVGRQLEGRVRASILPGHLTLDVGAARLSRGEFARTVGGTGNSTIYFYSELTFTGAVT